MPSGLTQAHPAVLVTAGLFCIAAIQLLGGLWLWALLLLLALAAASLHGRSWLRLLRRSRWVALALLVLFAWQTPGRAVFPLFWQLSPSHEGLVLAAGHIVRLAGMIAVVALLMARLRPEDWVAALHALAAPFRLLGLQTERFSVRLMLVLEALNQGDTTARQEWRKLLQPALPDDFVECGSWEVRDLHKSQACVLAALWLASFGVLAWLALS